MKRVYQKCGNLIVTVVFFVAHHAASRCNYNFYERKVPDRLKEMRNK